MNLSTIQECPALSDYERELLKRIDIKGEHVTGVAKSLGRDKSTVSVQRKRALGKLGDWQASASKPDPGRLASEVFRRLNKGVHLSEIIVELNLDPDIAMELHGKWLKVREAETVNSAEILRLVENAKLMSAAKRKRCSYVDKWGCCKRIWLKREPFNEFPSFSEEEVDGSRKYFRLAEYWTCALCPEDNEMLPH